MGWQQPQQQEQQQQDAIQQPPASRQQLAAGALALGVLLPLSALLAWQLFWQVVWPARWALLAGAAAAEAAFYLLYFRPTYARLNAIPSPCEPPGFTPTKAQATFARFIATAKALPGGVDPRHYLAPWFLDAPFDTIGRDNVAEMLTYGFYYRRVDDMTGELAGAPRAMVAELEAALHTQFTPGYTPGLRFMSHLWEPLRAHHRPLLLYAGMELLHLGQRLVMASYGFLHKRHGILGYYHTPDCGTGICIPAGVAAPSPDDDLYTPFADQLPPPAGPAAAPPCSAASTADGCCNGTASNSSSSSSSNPLRDALPPGSSAVPVLFLHGVGGLPLYLEMLRHVLALGHPVLVPEYAHVAMRLSSSIPTVDQVVDAIVGVMDREGIGAVCVVSHSFGTLVAGRLQALHPRRVHSLCLVDPVCIAMYMPRLLNSFVYRRPRVDFSNPSLLARDLALFFASRDVHVAAAFARQFYWTELNVWPEALPPGCCVVLSGEDDLCHAGEVAVMLQKMAGHVKVVLNPSLFHGAFLLHGPSKAGVLAEVEALLASSGSLVLSLAQPAVTRTLSAAASLLQDVEKLAARLSLSPSYTHGSSGTQHAGLRRTWTDHLPGRMRGRADASGGSGSNLALLHSLWAPAVVTHAPGGSQQQQQQEAAAAAAAAAAGSSPAAAIDGQQVRGRPLAAILSHCSSGSGSKLAGAAESAGGAAAAVAAAGGGAASANGSVEPQQLQDGAAGKAL